MPMLRTERRGSGRKDWLGSGHGVNHAPTGTLDMSAFTDTSYPDGYIPSGTPVDATDLTAVKPWTPTSSATGLGFVLDDMAVVEGETMPAAVLRHGSIVTANVPGDFTAPTGATAFIFE